MTFSQYEKNFLLQKYSQSGDVDRNSTTACKYEISSYIELYVDK